MAFINEIFPEERKNKFTFSVSTRPDGSKPTLWKWTIDRERDAFLVLTKTEGGSYEGTQRTEHYVLSWNGELVHFSGEAAVSSTTRTDQIISWRVHRLTVPPRLAEYRNEVFQLVREALDAMGWLYRRERVVAVKVDFDSSCESESRK